MNAAKRILSPFFACLIVALSCIAPLCAQSAPEDRLRVSVLDFTNKTGDSSFDTACGTISDNLVMTLKQLGSYRLECPAGIPSDITDRSLLEWCESNFVDYVLYGSVSSARGDSQKYELSVFSREKKRTTIRKNYSGESVFDVFSASDELTVSVLSTLTGRHVGFGTLTLKNTGKAGSFEATLDGIPLAANIASLERVTAGSHTVAVYEKQDDARTKVFEGSVAVNEGGTALVSFALKGATPSGTLIVQTKSDGDAYLDGLFAGKAVSPSSTFAKIPEGSHALEIRYPDGQSETANVSISAGNSVEASFSRVSTAAFGKAVYNWRLFTQPTISFGEKTYKFQYELFGKWGFQDFVKDAKLALHEDRQFQAIADQYLGRMDRDSALYRKSFLYSLGGLGAAIIGLIPLSQSSHNKAMGAVGGALLGSGLVVSIGAIGVMYYSSIDCSANYVPKSVIKYLNDHATK